jgi:hypothetical protein
MSELVFNVHLDEDGGYWAQSAGEAIFAQGDTWDEVCADAMNGVAAFAQAYPERKPSRIRLVLHVKREQELLVA